MQNVFEHIYLATVFGATSIGKTQTKWTNFDFQFDENGKRWFFYSTESITNYLKLWFLRRKKKKIIIFLQNFSCIACQTIGIEFKLIPRTKLNFPSIGEFYRTNDTTKLCHAIRLPQSKSNITTTTEIRFHMDLKI